MPNVRDKLWLWGHREGSHNDQYNLPARSRMTPFEAAAYLDLANFVMVCYAGQPEPPFAQSHLPLSLLDRVVWSIVGDLSSTRNDSKADLDEVIELAARFPNVCGGIMDDFFYEREEAGRYARYDVEQTRAFAERLHAATRPLELWVVLYDHLLDLPLAPYLAQCDVVTYWTGKAASLPQLETNFARAETMIGERRKMLGCYMWDFSQGRPMPVESMRYQCELGLEWLKSGRIDGMIFLASCICDLGLETVEWTREWIARTGRQTL